MSLSARALWVQRLNTVIQVLGFKIALKWSMVMFSNYLGVPKGLFQRSRHHTAVGTWHHLVSYGICGATWQ